jgi:hypothetical protein
MGWVTAPRTVNEKQNFLAGVEGDFLARGQQSSVSADI